jgi:hypothetical protein
MGRIRFSPIEVVNKTPYRGDDLRRFMYAGLHSKECYNLVKTVEFLVSPYFRTKGYAYCDEARIQIIFPRGFDPSSDMRELAQVFEHEVDHIFGLEHRDMEDWWTLNPTWQKKLKMRVRAKARKPQVEVNLERQIRRLIDRLDRVKYGV